ncbi:MAG: hypothetical protein IKX23_07115 [Treponema sp.]|nr:hypothetical protein [Treponema sp.]
MNCNRKTVFFVVFILFCFPLFAKEIELGGKTGWPVFQLEENIAKGKGRFGYDCIQLATNSFVYDENTDLLINFENPRKIISEGQYDVVSNNLKFTDQAKMAKGAGLSRNTGGLSIQGRPGTFFGSEGFMGSFSIEFWLCPSVAENGEIILKWESSKNVRGNLVHQLLNCFFSGGKLEWTLTDFFDNYTDAEGSSEIHLKGMTRIIPDTWSYHALSYDCENGILEYLVNGITEDIRYITSDGTEDGDISLVVLGRRSKLQLCSKYTGKIDDIRIMRRPYSQPDYQSAESAGKTGRMLYQATGGKFVTKPIVVSTGSRLNMLTAEMTVPDQCQVCYYVRSGDNYFNWTDSYPKWKKVESGKEIKGITGMFFQVSCEIYPDGDGSVTPTITNIKLDFDELPLPLPPFTVRAEAGDRQVTLSWNYSVDDTAGGYYIYYGNRPGEYLGRFAVEGDSPVNAGNVTSFTLTGLENGKIYYFAVAAWSSLDNRVIGPLSKEVYARPMSSLGK